MAPVSTPSRHTITDWAVAAEILGVSRATLHRHRVRARQPSGHCWFRNETALLTWYETAVRPALIPGSAVYRPNTHPNGRAKPRPVPASTSAIDPRAVARALGGGK